MNVLPALLFMGALWSANLFAQEDATPSTSDLYLHGQVMDVDTREPLRWTVVRVQELPSGEDLYSTLPDTTGRYALYVSEVGIYRLSFSSEGRIKKMVELDLTAVPDSLWADGGIEMELHITLMSRPAGMKDDPVFREPIGKCRYSEEEGMLAWDLEYTEQIKARIDAVLKASNAGGK